MKFLQTDDKKEDFYLFVPKIDNRFDLLSLLENSNQNKIQQEKKWWTKLAQELEWAY